MIGAGAPAHGENEIGACVAGVDVVGAVQETTLEAPLSECVPVLLRSWYRSL